MAGNLKTRQFLSPRKGCMLISVYIGGVFICVHLHLHCGRLFLLKNTVCLYLWLVFSKLDVCQSFCSTDKFGKSHLHNKAFHHSPHCTVLSI